MVDFAAEGLLDGLEGEARAARARLLRSLHEDGVSLDELRSSVADGLLFLLPAERMIGGEPEYTPLEVAEISGVPAEVLAELRQAQGLPVPDPEARVLTETDLNAARTARSFLDAGVGIHGMLEIARILGRGLSQAAEAMRRLTVELVFDPEAGEDELAQRMAAAVGQLQPMTAPMVGQMLDAHLRHAVRSELLLAADQADGGLAGARDVAVCFADLVGFTRMGEEVPPDELGAVADRLERLAKDVVSPPVRLVKTIGDAVMLVSTDVDALIGTALDLVAAADAEGEDFPQLRAGIAFGPALLRAGDWYGRPVNLAARITAIARPGSVLCDRAVRERSSGEWVWSFAGERRVKGVKEPVRLQRVRRADSTSASD
jgi:adenylate cyclase